MYIWYGRWLNDRMGGGCFIKGTVVMIWEVVAL